jgi:hypothetical protein
MEKVLNPIDSAACLPKYAELYKKWTTSVFRVDE